MNHIHSLEACFGVRHVLIADTDTYDYIELCDFFKLLTVSPCYRV